MPYAPGTARVRPGVESSPPRSLALDRLRGAALVAMLVHHFIGWLTEDAREVLPGWPTFALTDAAAPAFFVAAGASSALFVAGRRSMGIPPAQVAGQLVRRYGLLIPIGMALRWLLWRDPFGLGVLEVVGLTVLAGAVITPVVGDRLLPAVAVVTLAVGVLAERGVDGHRDWVADELVAGKFPAVTYLGFVLVGVAVARSGRLAERRWVAGLTLLAVLALVTLLADGIVPHRYPGDIPFVVPGLAITALAYAIGVLQWPGWLGSLDRLLRRAGLHTLGIFLAHYAIYYGLDRGSLIGGADGPVAVVIALGLTVGLCAVAPVVPPLPWSPRTGWRRATRRAAIVEATTSSPRTTSHLHPAGRS